MKTKGKHNPNRSNIYNSIQPTIREALAMHELFRRLGFYSDDIYVLYAQNGILMVLKDQGLEFSVYCGDISPHVTESEFKNIWTKYVNQWNGTCKGMNQHTRDRIFQESKLINEVGILSLVVGMQEKGFKIPYFEERGIPIPVAVVPPDSKNMIN